MAALKFLEDPTLAQLIAPFTMGMSLGFAKSDAERELAALEKARREENRRLAEAAKFAQSLFNASILGPASVFSVLQRGAL